MTQRFGLYDIPLNNWALNVLKPAEWFITDNNYQYMHPTAVNKKTKEIILLATNTVKK